MKKLVMLFSIACVLGFGILGLIMQGTSAGVGDSMEDPESFIASAVRIPGDSVRTWAVPAGSPQGKSLMKGKRLNTYIAAVDQDCWTVDEENAYGGHFEGEWYFFPKASYIFFVDKVKIPIGGLPNGFALDHFLWRCKPIVNRPYETVTVPAVWIDDIYWGPIPDHGEIVELLLIWAVPAADIARVLGTNRQVDWAVCKEYQADLLPDLDGNNRPDVCVEAPPLQFLYKEPDECGANFINFLSGNSANTLVCEAPFDMVPALPPRPPLPGMTWGENGETRPWCFWLAE